MPLRGRKHQAFFIFNKKCTYADGRRVSFVAGAGPWAPWEGWERGCGPSLRPCSKAGCLGSLARLGTSLALCLYGFIVMPQGQPFLGDSKYRSFPCPQPSHLDP